MRIDSSTKICMGIGDPIKQSLGPLLHNTGYKELGIDDEFVYVSSHVKPEDLEDFMKGARAMGLRGITSTLPHKEKIMKFVDKIDPHAQKIGAVNTVVNDNGTLTGHNSDWIGAITPLKNATGGSLKGKKVAVIGAGGAAKAFIYGLTREGSEVIVFNRTLEKAKTLGEHFDCDYSSLDEQSKIKTCDIVCNASSVGLAGTDTDGKSPINPDNFNPDQIVFDAIYAPLKTRFLEDAQKAGAKTIAGTEMLLYQGFMQFKLYTGQDAPQEAMRESLLERLGGK